MCHVLMIEMVTGVKKRSPWAAGWQTALLVLLLITLIESIVKQVVVEVEDGNDGEIASTARDLSSFSFQSTLENASFVFLSPLRRLKCNIKSTVMDMHFFL